MAADGTAVVGGPVVVASAVGRDVAVTLVTVIMVVVVGLTFAFGFGNVFQLGLRLGALRGARLRRGAPVPNWLIAQRPEAARSGRLLSTGRRSPGSAYRHKC